MPLPPGLALDRDTGLITGVPTVPGTYTYTLVVRDAQGAVRQIPVTHTINPYDPPVIAVAPGVPSVYATRTVAYSADFNITGGSGPFTWSIGSGTLPTGLAIDPASGVISGTPTDLTYTDRPLTVRVVDSFGSVAQYPYTLRYRNALSTAHIYPAAVQAEAYSSTPVIVGGHAPLVFAITGGTLPAGLSMDTTTGRIFGTPSAVGSTALTVQITDAAGDSAEIAQTFESLAAYVALAITGGMTGTSKTYQRATGSEVISPGNTLGTTGGSGTITWSWARISGSTKISAAAPSSRTTGFNCSAAPGENVSALFRATATDGITSATYDVTVTGNNTYVFPVLSGSPPTLATFGKAYTGSFTLSGGKAPVTYAIVGGTLPAGISLNTSTGVISGTPSDTTYTDRTITIRVTDAEGQTNDRGYTLQYRAAVQITGTPGPGYTTQAYSFVPTIAGGHAPYNVTLQSGALPTGTSLNASTGAVTGTVTTPGVYNYTLRVTDADGNVDDTPFSTTVNAYTVPSLSGSYAGTATRTKAYNSSGVTRSNGLAPFTWSIINGSVPPGINLNTSTGQLSGTPTTTSWNTYTFQARVVDALGNVAESGVQNINYRDVPTMVGRTFPGLLRTQAINQSVATSASPLHTPVNYSVIAGSLPTGASLNTNTGQITGTLTSTSYGDYSITIRATDAVGNTEDATYLQPYANVMSVSNSGTALEAEVGWGWTSSVTASGGFPGYTYAVVSGALPAGVSLNSGSGALSGNPTTAGSGSYVIRATDSIGNTANSATINWTVYAAITRTAQWAGGSIYRTVSIGTQQGITVTGGKAAITYSVASGALPAGVSLNAGTGQLTGTPTTNGAYSFVLRATDALGAFVDTTTISGTVSNPVSLSNRTIAAFQNGGTATAAIQLNSNGIAYQGKNGSFTTLAGEWLRSGAAGDYESRWTTTSGTLTSGSNGAWENLGTTRTWTRNRVAVGGESCIGTLEIRRASDGLVITSATIELYAENVV